MNKGKMLAVIVVSAVFLAFAAGSGSDNSTRDSVTIDSDGNTTSNNTNKNSADNNGIKYEITHTGFEYGKSSIGTMRYFGYVEIKNTGTTDIYLDDCNFDLEDKDGHLLQTDNLVSKCPDVIAPGETGYFYNSLGFGSIDDSVSLDNGIRLTPQMKLSQAKKKQAFYPVSDVSVRKGTFDSITVTGRIENNTDKDVSYIDVDIIFYDKSGKVLSIIGTSVSDVGAGLKASFEATSLLSMDNLKLEDIANTKVIASGSYYQF
jgi:hypothetical protein